MTRTFFVSLTVLLALSSLGLAQDPVPTLSCSSPILDDLKILAGATFADAFYDQPTESTSETCKLQWGLNKTCCKPDRIASLAEKLFTAWRDRVDAFVKKLDVIEKDLAPRADSAALRVSDLQSKVTANTDKLSSSRIDESLVQRAKDIA